MPMSFGPGWTQLRDSYPRFPAQVQRSDFLHRASPTQEHPEGALRLFQVQARLAQGLGGHVLWTEPRRPGRLRFGHHQGQTCRVQI